MSIGKNISKFRKVKGLSISELARKAGVSKSYLWQVENKKNTNPSIDFLTKVAEHLEVTIADLLDKPKTQIKKIEIPDEIDKNLLALIKERKRKNNPINENILGALLQIQMRKGRKPQSKEDWAYLLETIERVLKVK